MDCKEEHCVGRSRREKVEGPSREEGGVCPDLRSTALLCKKYFKISKGIVDERDCGPPYSLSLSSLSSSP